MNLWAWNYRKSSIGGLLFYGYRPSFSAILLRGVSKTADAGDCRPAPCFAGRKIREKKEFGSTFMFGRCARCVIGDLPMFRRERGRNPRGGGILRGSRTRRPRTCLRARRPWTQQRAGTGDPAAPFQTLRISPLLRRSAAPAKEPAGFPTNREGGGVAKASCPRFYEFPWIDSTERRTERWGDGRAATIRFRGILRGGRPGTAGISLRRRSAGVRLHRPYITGSGLRRLDLSSRSPELQRGDFRARHATRFETIVPYVGWRPERKTSGRE